MVGMGVGNEGGFLRFPRIQPEIQLWQMESPVEIDFDHRSKLTGYGHPAISSGEERMQDL
jgi:hypothetical protein